jgi:uncharacterized protein (DUF58 family)
MTDTIILEQQPLQSRSSAGTNRKRLYIFPTQHGLVFAIMLAVMLMGAINYTNSMAYMLTFLLASLFMVSMLHTYRNLRGLVISTSNARSVFAGEVAEFPIMFDNRSGPDRTSINIHPRQGFLERKKLNGMGIDFVFISRGQMYRDNLPVKTTIRGHIKVGRLKIHSSYPLGLFRAWSYMSSNSYCVVYPKPEGDSRLPYFSEYTALDLQGDKVGTDDFTGFRHYRPGDSIRNIDWKILAREQGVMVKKFSGTGARQLILHWEQTSHLGNIEARLSQLALWIIKAEQFELRYGLELPGSKIALDNGKRHQHRCLSMLAGYGQDNIT